MAKNNNKMTPLQIWRQKIGERTAKLEAQMKIVLTLQIGTMLTLLGILSRLLSRG